MNKLLKLLFRKDYWFLERVKKEQEEFRNPLLKIVDKNGKEKSVKIKEEKKDVPIPALMKKEK